MSRFNVVLNTYWLCLRRCHFPRDLRVMFVNYAKKHMFDWETDELIYQRFQGRCEFGLFNNLSCYRFQIPQVVQPWCPDPIDQDDMHLRLTRISLKPHYFLPQKKMWCWLSDV